jgi:hypothetical protein
LGIEADEIDYIFPYSPLQEGIIMSQAKDNNNYQTQLDLLFSIPSGERRLNPDGIKMAWRELVRRHAIPRALLVENLPGSSKTMHFILKDPTPDVNFYIPLGRLQNISRVFSHR